MSSEHRQLLDRALKALSVDHFHSDALGMHDSEVCGRNFGFDSVAVKHDMEGRPLMPRERHVAANFVIVALANRSSWPAKLWSNNIFKVNSQNYFLVFTHRTSIL